MTPPSTIAHYRIISKLGEGGMGAVYRATDTRLNRDVAIKVLPPVFADDVARMQRFEREAQLLATLNHPNIAAIYGIEAGAIVMELVEGADLAGPVPVETAIAYARQIAAALEAAHEKGIIHRDLKPANIKVTPDGNIKLLDFGLAKATEQSGAPSAVASPTMSPTLSLAMTQAGMILGTAAYMSPEQARGYPVDRRADIWAFGVILFELLTGKMLYGGGATITDTLAAVVLREPEYDALPPDTPPRVRRLIERCLRKDPKLRLRDVGEARIALEEGVEAPPPAAPVAAPRGVPRWMAGLAAAFALAAAGLAVVHFTERPPAAEPLHFEVTAPDQWAYGNTPLHNGLALSPDGRQLAFVGVNNLETAIWLHSFVSGATRQLPGTDGGNAPFWSPDGRFIGFFTPGKLKKIDITGGPPVTLCDVVNAAVGGSWSKEGVILFGINTGPLFRVPQAGGAATPQTALDTARHETYHARPWFLPDGQRYLFLALSDDAAAAAIYLGSLQSQNRKRLVAAREAPAYSPPAPGADRGHVLFLREGTLMALPVDPKSIDPAGDPFPVAEKVGFAISSAFFTASNTGALAYRTSGNSGENQLQWYTREGTQTGYVGPVGNGREMSLSPDGLRVAVSRFDNVTGKNDIWILDVGRGVPTRFTFDPATDRTPIWSPDGKSVIFTSARPPGLWQLYIKDAAGASNEQLLLKTDVPNIAWDWSGDGRFLLYGTVDTAQNYDVWSLPLEGDRKPLPYLMSRSFNERYAQFSPGPAGAPRFVAYVSNESGRAEVYVQPFPAGKGGKFQISSDGGSQPRWRRDGKELYFISPDGKLMAADVTLLPSFRSGPPKALFTTRIYGGASGATLAELYAPSADGKKFLISTQTQEGAASPVTVLLNWTTAFKR